MGFQNQPPGFNAATEFRVTQGSAAAAPESLGDSASAERARTDPWVQQDPWRRWSSDQWWQPQDNEKGYQKGDFSDPPGGLGSNITAFGRRQ